MSEREALYPVFLKLAGRPVLVVGGGPIACEKAGQLVRAGARVTAVAPSFVPAFDALGVARVERAFAPADLDGAWLVVSAATPSVNRDVRREADRRRVFAVTVDDPGAASAYGAAIVERGGVTFAIATGGVAPALTRLLREALEAVLPDDMDRWVEIARRERPRWREGRVPIAARRGLLFSALAEMYGRAS